MGITAKRGRKKNLDPIVEVQVKHMYVKSDMKLQISVERYMNVACREYYRDCR